MWSWDSAQVRAGTRMCVYHGLACARVCVCVCSTRVPVGTWYLASSVTLRDGPGLPSRQSGGDRDRRSSALPARGGLWTLSCREEGGGGCRAGRAALMAFKVWPGIKPKEKGHGPCGPQGVADLRAHWHGRLSCGAYGLPALGRKHEALLRLVQDSEARVRFRVTRALALKAPSGSPMPGPAI